MNASFFIDFYKNQGLYPLPRILEDIQSGRWAEEVNQHQRALATGNTEKAERLKKSLPAFTVSATYSGARKMDYLTRYNSLLILDIDKLEPEQIAILSERIRQAPYTVFCFISPGGRGLKIGVRPVTRHALTVNNHVRNFSVAAAWYEAYLDVKIDPSGKDVGRLCFVSFDPELYIAPEYRAFLESGEEGNLPGELPFMEDREVSADEPIDDGGDYGTQLRLARKMTTRRLKYREGNRNNYIFQFGCRCRQKKIPFDRTLVYALESFKDLPEGEIHTTLQSGYQSGGEEDATGKKKKPQMHVSDIQEYLGKHYVFRFNVVRQRVEYRKKRSRCPYETVDKRKLNSLWCELLAAGINCQYKVFEAVLHSDFVESFDPFVGYFESLPAWDGTTDYIGSLAATVQTTQQALWEECLRRWLVALVGCAICEKVVNHTVLLLTGPQGIGKTEWCCRLVPPELSSYRRSGPANSRSKDVRLALSECLLANLDELGSLTEQELNQLKEMITTGIIYERRSFGTHSESYVRRVSFTASANVRVLTDISGSRRFLSFWTISIDYLTPIDYAGLYAQALYLFRSGYKYWFDGAEIEALNRNNEEFRIQSPYEELFYTYFRKPEAKDSRIQYLSVAQIMHVLSLKTFIRITDKGTNLLSEVLKKEGFEGVKRGKRRLFKVVILTDEEVKAERNGEGRLWDGL